MPLESETARGVKPGQFSQVWRYYCSGCTNTLDVEAVGGYLNAGQAHAWARETYGWSRTKHGWTCPACKRARSGQRKNAGARSGA
jgi:hypothetical protein